MLSFGADLDFLLENVGPPRMPYLLVVLDTVQKYGVDFEFSVEVGHCVHCDGHHCEEREVSTIYRRSCSVSHW